MLRWDDATMETCFACGEKYDYFAPGSGRTLALCPECQEIADDLAPNAGLSLWNHMMAMLTIGLIPWTLSHEPAWLVGAVLVGAMVAVFVNAFRLTRLGAQIRDERSGWTDG